MFAAINYITCAVDYCGRFEQLFASRAHAIDRMPGFHHMRVLKPQKEGEPYLILSFWESEQNFHSWQKSPEFLEGHKRGFEDVRLAVSEGRPAPMHSEFRTYEVIAE